MPDIDPDLERLKERGWREVAAIDAALARGRLRALIGRIADVVTVGAGRVDFHGEVFTGCFQRLAERTFGHRRTADITQANK